MRCLACDCIKRLLDHEQLAEVILAQYDWDAVRYNVKENSWDVVQTCNIQSVRRTDEDKHQGERQNNTHSYPEACFFSFFLSWRLALQDADTVPHPG